MQNTILSKLYLLKQPHFICLLMANILWDLAAYLLIPNTIFAPQIANSFCKEEAFFFLTFGFGLFTFGAINNYLVQVYRRRTVCVISQFCFFSFLVFYFYIAHRPNLFPSNNFWLLLCATKFVMGAFWGLSKIILAGTLIIDKCKSADRSLANEYISWTSRLSLPLSFIAFSALKQFSFAPLWLCSMLSIGLSMLCLCCVKFPFRVPYDDVKWCSLDRFFHIKSFRWFTITLLITFILGLFFAQLKWLLVSELFLVGLILSFSRLLFLIKDQYLKREFLCEIAILSLLLPTTYLKKDITFFYILSLILGFVIGNLGRIMQQYFTLFVSHTERSTAQNTFILGRELGLYMGLFVGLSFIPSSIYFLYIASGAITLILLLIYIPIKNRKKNNL